MHTYVNHAHVVWGVLALALGVVGLVLGLIRKVVLVAVLAVALVIVGAIVAGVALHGTHCTPTSHEHVCVSVSR